MAKRKAPNHPILFFKEKEKTKGVGRSKFGGQWKGPMFGGP